MRTGFGFVSSLTGVNPSSTSKETRVEATESAESPGELGDQSVSTLEPALTRSSLMRLARDSICMDLRPESFPLRGVERRERPESDPQRVLVEERRVLGVVPNSKSKFW